MSRGRSIAKAAGRGALALVLTFVIAFVGFMVFSEVVYHRSAQATVQEWQARSSSTGALGSVSQTQAILAGLANEEEEPLSLDTDAYESDCSISEYEGMQVVTFGAPNADNVIFYIHGGAFIFQIDDNQLQFCDRLSQRLNAYVVAPLYPLAPKHTYDEAYPLLEGLYDQLQEQTDAPITFMGDSAGGGLALSFAEHLGHQGMELPDSIVAISPWVDVSMSVADHSGYEDVDPTLGVAGLAIIGEAWAGEASTTNPKVSPYFGYVSCLPKTMLLVGTRELFCPDVEAFYDKLQSAGVDAQLVEGEGLNHVYPMTSIPEAGTAFDQICSFIQG